MKLADVLAAAKDKDNGNGVRIEVTPEPAPAPAPAATTPEPAPAATTGGGYVDLNITKKTSVGFYCPVCGRRAEKGETVAVIQAEGKSVRTYCHLECVGKWNGVADAGAVDTATIEKIAGNMDAGERNRMTVYVDTQDAKVEGEVDRLRDQIAELEEAIGRTQTTVIEVRLPERTVTLEGERFHPAFEEVLDLIADGEEVFLPGPTGCGKTHMCEQIARALGRQFGHQSLSGGVTESKFFGCSRPGPSGGFEFRGTKFLDCYENGGVFLLDEMDGADENVLISLNSALANGFCSVPDRHDNPIAKRHPDFVAIAAANTFGRGADRLYVGRNQLDEATLDRFRAGTVDMEYDRDLERDLCPDTELLERLWKYRDRVVENKLERVVSTRFIVKAYRAVQRCKESGKTYGYSSVYEYIDSKLFKGWSDREVRSVRGSLVETPKR